MAVTRSPAYPGIAINDAVELVAKIYNENRTNPVDRDAAARDMGYAGMTGSSSKALADLSHYGLIEKAGKGAVRVSQRAVDVLYPASPEGRSSAYREAAFSPALFGELRAQFPDGTPSENNLRSYLMRMGFATSAIPYVLTSYRETCRMAQETGASESHGVEGTQIAESSPPNKMETNEMPESAIMERARPPAPQIPASALQSVADALSSPQLNRINMNIQGDKVHLSGLLDHKGLDALEKKIVALRVLLDVYNETIDTGDANDAEYDL